MAKFFLFSAFFLVFSFGENTTKASSTCFSSLLGREKPLDCSAPAPTNFRIISQGPDFISLAWTPAWVGATHTLLIEKILDETQSEYVGIFYQIGDTTFTFTGASPDTAYRFIIATECVNGEVSHFTSEVESDKTILDLTIMGRSPVNPISIPCTGINMNDYSWVGFTVSGVTQNIFLTNTFEIAQREGGALRYQIKRVGDNSPIVAVTPTGNWPNIDNPVLISPNPFQMALKSNLPNFFKIGQIHLSYNNGNPEIIDLCQVLDDPSNPWSKFFTYTVLVEASGKKELISRFEMPLSNTKYFVTNPFDDRISIFTEFNITSDQSTRIQIFSLGGELIIDKDFELFDSSIEVETNGLPSGLYLLMIRQQGERQVFKLVKNQ